MTEPDSDMRWFLEFRSKYTNWRESLYSLPDGWKYKVLARIELENAQEREQELALEYRLVERDINEF